MGVKINENKMNQATKQSYISRINNVINYIENNIDNEVRLKDLAQVADFSPFHFHRIFKALVGETVNTFIRRIRVEKGAMMLAYNPELSIIKIAMKNGFSSSQSFSRDFKEFFNITPSEFREQNNSKICHTLSKNRNDSIFKVCYDGDKGRHFIQLSSNSEKNVEVYNKINMKVEIKNLEPMHVAYIRHIGPYVGNSDIFGKLFGQLCGWAGPKNLIGPNSQFMTVYYEDPKVTAPEKLRMDVCMTVPEDTKVDGEVCSQTLGGGKYAVARFELKDPREYEGAWNSVYGQWLPESGCEPDNRPSLEIYRNDPKSDPNGLHIVDICIPIK